MSPMLALYSWPIISFILLRRYQVTLGILLALLLGYMFLPSRFAIDFPVVPPMGKNAIPALTIVGLVVLIGSQFNTVARQKGLFPRHWLACVLIALLILGPLGTVWANQDAIITPLAVKRPLRPYDGFSMASTAALLILPVLIGRTFFARPEQHRMILVVLCLAACAYAFLALYEARLSPRLNRMVYGFNSHSWRQHIRGGGFRPMIFMEHGLRVALFFAMATMAAAGLTRMKWRTGPMIFATIWLFGTLVICKSLGALIITTLMLPLLLFLNIRLTILASAIIAMSVLTYPILRGSGLIPVEKALSLAVSYDTDRAQSLFVRLQNEDELLNRAQDKPLFGWGGFGRERIRNEKGIDVTIADGYWVIIIGQGGWARYIGEFGLMTFPMLGLFYRRRDLNITWDTAILSAILAANMIDLIPNSGQTPITWLIAGALWGRLELGRHVQPPPGEDGGDEGTGSGPPPSGHAIRAPVYTRDFGNKPPPRKPVTSRPIKDNASLRTSHGGRPLGPGLRSVSKTRTSRT